MRLMGEVDTDVETGPLLIGVRDGDWQGVSYLQGWIKRSRSMPFSVLIPQRFTKRF